MSQTEGKMTREELVAGLREFADGMPQAWEEDRSYRDSEIERLTRNKKMVVAAADALAHDASMEGVRLGNPDDREAHPCGIEALASRADSAAHAAEQSAAESEGRKS